LPDGITPDLGQADRAAADAAPRVYGGPLFRRRAEAGELALFELDEVVVSASGALELRAGGGHPGKDPFPAGSYHGGNYYSGGSFRQGAARSTPWVSARPFDSVLPSFEAETPPGTWIAVGLSVRVGGVWSKDYALGVWASAKGTVARHSVDGQDDATARVQTDTLVLTQKADAVRFVVQLFSEGSATPRLRAVAAIVAESGAAAPNDTPTAAALGKLLEVPKRSQMVYPETDGWCSPTSTSMVLAHWSARLGNPALLETVPAAADGIYDFVYDGTGNWTFNTAHAASLAGGALHAVVTRMQSLRQAERLIAAEIPLVISISFGAGELTGGPISATTGHLIVLRGFTASGDVVCNDPAFASDAAVQVTYKRAELEQAWSHSQRTAYLIWPVGLAPPVDPLGAF
jgi:hypothetical protein